MFPFYSGFDNIRNEMNRLMSDFDTSYGGSNRGVGRQKGGFGSELEDFPILTSGWNRDTNWNQPTQRLRGREDEKMDETSGQSQALTKQEPGILQIIPARVNVEDKEKELVVTAEIPGFDKENIKVTCGDDRTLHIEAKQKTTTY